MKIVELIRVEEHEEYGTFGVLKINKEAFCVTLEPPDLENKRSVSSIPAQQYICKRYSSAWYPNTFEITGVPDRSKVLIHPGNRAKDTEGCLLLAQYFGKLRGDRAVLNSGMTFEAFMKRMKDDLRFHLTIYELF